jgi:hypothetical protein
MIRLQDARRRERYSGGSIQTGVAMAEETLDRATIDAPKAADLPPGLRARYHVHTVIGEGRSKRVFRVHDSRLDRDVALALIKAPGIRGDALRIRTSSPCMTAARRTASPTW